MFFIDSDQRKRNAFVEASLSTAADHLALPEVQRAIPEYSKVYLGIIDMLYVPNIRHGVIQPPDKKRPYGIPVAALEAHERPQIHSFYASQHPIQRRNSKEILSSWFSSEVEINATLDAIGQDIVKDDKPTSLNPLGEQVAARVFNWAVPKFLDSPKAGKSPVRYFSGWPAVFFAYQEAKAHMPSETTVHEIEHVVQALAEPVKKGEGDAPEVWRLRREIIAYTMECNFIIGLVASGFTAPENVTPTFQVTSDGEIVTHAARLANLAQETNRDRSDKFFPNGTLRKVLAERDIDI